MMPNRYANLRPRNYVRNLDQKYLHRGKFFSEALFLASTNPQYDKRLFIKLRVQYMKNASSEHVLYIKKGDKDLPV